MTKGVIDAEAILNRARPLAHQEAPEIQPYGQPILHSLQHRWHGPDLHL